MEQTVRMPLKCWVVLCCKKSQHFCERHSSTCPEVRNRNWSQVGTNTCRHGDGVVLLVARGTRRKALNPILLNFPSHHQVSVEGLDTLGRFSDTFIPCYRIAVGYHGFTLVLCVSVHPSVVRPLVCCMSLCLSYIPPSVFLFLDYNE